MDLSAMLLYVTALVIVTSDMKIQYIALFTDIC